MSMQLNQVINYYIGQKYRYRFVDWEPESWSTWTQLTVPRLTRLEDASIDKIQLALRRLSDMEEEEAKGFLLIVQGDDARYRSHNETAVFYSKPGVWAGDSWFIYNSPEAFHYLLQRGFDLWNLIDNKHAVDVKTINT